MTRRTLISGATAAAVSVAALALAACPGPTEGEREGEEFTASLNVGQIVGASVESAGTGVASFTFDGAVLGYTIDVENMTGVTMAHIHGPASASMNAAIRLWLFSPPSATGAVSGRLVSGAVTASSPGFEGGATLDEVIRLMRNDSAYVLVHTSVYPDGEIRGRIIP